LERFALESCIEFTADFNRCLVHGLDGSLFTQFSVRQFEAASEGFHVLRVGGKTGGGIGRTVCPIYRKQGW